jgi:hypothetical protein
MTQSAVREPTPMSEYLVGCKACESQFLIDHYDTTPVCEKCVKSLHSAVREMLTPVVNLELGLCLGCGFHWAHCCCAQT